MPKIQVNEKDIGEALTKKDRGFFGNMFAEPVFGAGSTPSEVPAAPTTAVAPAKAVVPAGIIIPASAPAVPKATITAGIIPDAAPAPPAPAESEKKTSEWI